MKIDNKIISEAVQAGENLLKIDVLPENARNWIETKLPEPDPVITSLFDKKTKVWLMGASKARKSFFLLQMALHIAGGFSFLKWDIPKKRRVLLVQVEIPEEHYQKRLHNMQKQLFEDSKPLENLYIINGRGKVGAELKEIEAFFSEITNTAKRLNIDVICIDPIYKFLLDENSPNDWKPVLKSLDNLCNNTECVVICVHHYAKGFSSSKQAVDRGSGSGVVARDMDCAIYIDKHKNDDLLVVETIQRCYPPKENFSIEFIDGVFEESDTPPTLKTVNDLNRSKKTGLSPDEAMEFFLDGAKQKKDFKKFLEDYFPIREISSFINSLIENEMLSEFQGRGKPKYIGTPDQILKIKSGAENA